MVKVYAHCKFKDGRLDARIFEVTRVPVPGELITSMSSVDDDAWASVFWHVDSVAHITDGVGGKGEVAELWMSQHLQNFGGWRGGSGPIPDPPH